MVIGLIQRVHVRSDVLNEKEDATDPEKLQPLVRLGAISYSRITEAYNIPRPKWAEVKGDVEPLYEKTKEGKSKI